MATSRLSGRWPRTGSLYGFIGDRNGQGRNGESPSRIFQRFDCPDPFPDTLAIVTCEVRLRYSSTLRPGESAVLIIDNKVYRMPNTGGQWRGPIRVDGGQCIGNKLIQFNVTGVRLGNVAGALCVDDVEAKCVLGWVNSGLPQVNASMLDRLPSPPDSGESEPVPFDEHPIDAPGGNRQQGLFFLVLVGALLFYAMLRVVSGNQSVR